MELIGLPDWLLLAATAFILLYLYVGRNRNYWKKQNVPQEDFSLIFGPAMRLLLRPFHENDTRRYQKFGRVFGIYEGSQPTLLVGEPELVKQVLVKDFPLLSNRRMNEMIQACAEITAGHLKNAAQQKKDICVKEFYSHYALDVIARCAFGTKLDSHSDATNEFVAKARKAFSGGITLPLVLFFLFPGLMKVLKIKPLNSDAFQYFKDVSLSIIQKRKQKECRQEDFLQLMMDAREGALQESSESNTGKESSEMFNLVSDIKNDINCVSKALSEDEALAQCVLFFLAGQDTTSSVIAFAIYSLALNPDVQAKLRNEADECFATHGKEPSLVAISKLPYLHCVVSETLRMYPPAPRLERAPLEDYILGDTGIRVPKGCVVGVPVYAMHYDAEFFPNPEKFDPDRFSEENVGSIRPYSYLPFGAGPRNCIGMRFALQAVKLSLLHSVHSVQFVPTEKTDVPLKFAIGLGILNTKNITVGIRERPER
ncbi:cytochrome P450 3A8 isoform X1 [Rhipicephalus microplus]|uniref:cytochrome P450 3A8 isoform X1 n=1 Tax=Rhipicephalus microplus TaxID=6941 RepID=UPI003F6AD2D1